ncbi:MAG TPA: hypothetical protein VEB42_14405, partial [Chitinophagaceae bacterium]|nr:hypothetical protein [Chitinophagaceae bacterium]
MRCQNIKHDLREADDQFNNQAYASALPAFLDALEKEPEHALLNYKVGVCYLNSRSQKAKAVPYLEKAVLNSTSYLTKSYASDKEAPLNAYK